MDSCLKGNNALITGSSSGIGKGIAIALAKEGVNIIVASRNPDPNVIKQIQSLGVMATSLSIDVSKESQITKMFNNAIKKISILDLFINNVASHWDEPVTKITTKNWFKVINTNLTSCILACREASRLMIAQKTGNILIIGSTATWNPLAGEATYRISKVGVSSYMETLAVELAPFGIRVNLLTPGGFNTPMLDKLDPRLKNQTVKREIPLKRLGNTEELGPSAILLLSDKLSPYTTGSELVVDGGLKLRPLPIFNNNELIKMNS